MADESHPGSGESEWRGSGARIEKITRNAAGELAVTFKGRSEPVVDARVVRCFPWTLTESFISIRDKSGKELALLKSLGEIDPASREVVEAELYDKNFNPRVTRLISHKREFGVSSITVETDRGTVTFQVRSRDDVRHLSPTRLLFRDADGNAYEIADIRQLDPASRRQVQEYF